MPTIHRECMCPICLSYARLVSMQHVILRKAAKREAAHERRCKSRRATKDMKVERTMKTVEIVG